MGHYYPHLIPKDKTSLLMSRLGYRTVNTVVVSIVAASVPHFSLFAGLIGALTFWPLSGRPADWSCVPACAGDHAYTSVPMSHLMCTSVRMHVHTVWSF